MKCENPDCNRGIGLVSHRRSWLDKHRYCSKRCCDAVTDQITRRRRLRHQRATMSYFEWLFSQPITNSANVRVETSYQTCRRLPRRSSTD